MKQKTVIKVQMEDARQRSKALKIVVGFPGVVSATIEGANKDQIAVVGEGVDPVSLTSSLMKKMGTATLVTVATIEEEKKEEKKTTPPTVVMNPSSWSYPYQVVSVPQHQYDYAVCYDRSEENCSIM